MGKADADETELVQLLVAGDRPAFERIYRKHNAALIRVATGIVASRATAEEVAQDTWIAVLKNVASFEGRSSLAGWIFSILINKARSRAAREGRFVSFDGEGEDDNLAAAFDGRGRWKDMPDLWEEVTPERILAGRSVMDHVAAAIETLPAAQRSVIILRAQQGLEAEEVCEILGISEGNMRVLLHRARLAIRTALDGLM
ncbi:RNA polymerase sigma factor [Aminobacter ciceronei]|uniref:RNA polymerase sigma-70 factor (ECF subfamily) n=1 Tax=Aminobacter ciceronei TaxID=150723 RepID=A0ABR6C8I2_9HYPH|nr:sigma-70 family RNA polymerase sigma factor [Aminobacter ciceronei]MBA8907577.1 RNA polymerase sigma-70 factor (ECF subfamily) [Aminobacter ciceronei]MBA9021322.1 RNA polymerase sigma-70 factor (ECF subfamily) [Aminobacter ciceronei]